MFYRYSPCIKRDQIAPWFIKETLHYSDVIMGAMASQITSRTIVYSTVYSGADQRKRQSSASLAFVRRIHRGPVNSPHKWAVTRKLVPFDDVIMSRYTRYTYLTDSNWMSLVKCNLCSSTKNVNIPLVFTFLIKIIGNELYSVRKWMNFLLLVIHDNLNNSSGWVGELIWYGNRFYIPTANAIIRPSSCCKLLIW